LDQPEKKKEYLLSDQNCFPLKIKEKLIYVQATDYITNNQNYDFNMKNFVSFFRIHTGQDNLARTGYKF